MAELKSMMLRRANEHGGIWRVKKEVIEARRALSDQRRKCNSYRSFLRDARVELQDAWERLELDRRSTKAHSRLRILTQEVARRNRQHDEMEDKLIEMEESCANLEESLSVLELRDENMEGEPSARINRGDYAADLESAPIASLGQSSSVCSQEDEAETLIHRYLEGVSRVRRLEERLDRIDPAYKGLPPPIRLIPIFADQPMLQHIPYQSMGRKNELYSLCDRQLPFTNNVSTNHIHYQGESNDSSDSFPLALQIGSNSDSDSLVGEPEEESAAWPFAIAQHPRHRMRKLVRGLELAWTRFRHVKKDYREAGYELEGEDDFFGEEDSSESSRLQIIKEAISMTSEVSRIEELGIDPYHLHERVNEWIFDCVQEMPLEKLRYQNHLAAEGATFPLETNEFFTYMAQVWPEGDEGAHGRPASHNMLPSGTPHSSAVTEIKEPLYEASERWGGMMPGAFSYRRSGIIRQQSAPCLMEFSILLPLRGQAWAAVL